MIELPHIFGSQPVTSFINFISAWLSRFFCSEFTKFSMNLSTFCVVACVLFLAIFILFYVIKLCEDFHLFHKMQRIRQLFYSKKHSITRSEERRVGKECRCWWLQ